jgi:pimeloyl-ACP methyl ester carboxylesterase
MPDPVSTGYAAVNGVEMYWDSRGEGAPPLIVVHGGFGLAGMFGDLLDRLAASRRVIAVELRAMDTPAISSAPSATRRLATTSPDS